MKKIVFLCGFVGLMNVIGIVAGGCGGSKCQQLADAQEQRYEECGVPAPTNTSNAVECTETLAKTDECYIPCYQKMDCILLKDPTNPDAMTPAQDFSDCLLACAK